MRASRSSKKPPSSPPCALLTFRALDTAREAHLALTPATKDAEGEILDLNPAFTALTGYAFSDVASTPLSALFNAKTSARLHDGILAGICLHRDLVLVRKDKSEVEIELEILPAKEKGQMWLAILRPSTSLKKVEQALQENEERLNGLLESLSDIAWAMSATLDRFIYLSPSTERVFGRPVTDFQRTPQLWFSMIHPEDFPQVIENLKAATTRGELHSDFELTYRILREDGEIRLLRNRGRVVFEKNEQSKEAPQALYFQGVADDITTGKMVELHMERMANFPRFNPNPIYELSETGEVTYSNEAALRLAQSLGFEDPGDILPADVGALVSDCVAKHEPLRRREETYGERTFTWSFFPIPDTHLVHCYAGEITERLRLESQLRLSEKLKSIGQLAGGVAHDFNNILTVIHGFTNLLLAREDQDPWVVEQLTQISVASERARDLTRQLLTFSRRQVMKPTTLNLDKIITDLAKMLVRLLGEPIELRVLPNPQEAWVEGDRSMLEQIILNLVANARDAIGQSGVVTLATELVEIPANIPLPHPDARHGRFIRLSARDNGCGMDERTLSRIFEPFFTTKEVGKGTGLGLSTVYGAVKQHEGWIQVESEIGVGTTFHVFLPAAKPGSEKAAAAAPIEAKALGGTETILVVEDELPVRQLILTILKGAGYTVFDAKNGLEAIGIWEEKNEQISVLLTDLVMPGLISGIDLAEKLLGDKPDLKVIFSSGYSADVMGEKRSFESTTHFLAKPYLPQALLKIIRDSLDNPIPPPAPIKTAENPEA